MHTELVVLQALKIDWANMPTYNTIMSVAAGAGLIGLVVLGRELRSDIKEVNTDGWALLFGVLGFILTTTGLHMSLTWPLASGGFPFDNIIFGETSLAFGVMLLAAALYLWKRAAAVIAGQNPLRGWARVARPLTIFIAGMGLSLVALAIAGIKYQLFAAPPQEPISGLFSGYPMIEATFISALLALVGVGALSFSMLVTKVATGQDSGSWAALTGWVWTISGVLFLLFGAMNYFTHIGLIINTM